MKDKKCVTQVPVFGDPAVKKHSIPDLTKHETQKGEMKLRPVVNRRILTTDNRPLTTDIGAVYKI